MFDFNYVASTENAATKFSRLAHELGFKVEQPVHEHGWWIVAYSCETYADSTALIHLYQEQFDS